MHQNVSPHLEHLNGRKSSLLQDLMLQCWPRPIRSTLSELAIFNDSSHERDATVYRICSRSYYTPFTLYTHSISGDTIFRLMCISCHDTHAQFCIYTTVLFTCKNSYCVRTIGQYAWATLKPSTCYAIEYKNPKTRHSYPFCVTCILNQSNTSHKKKRRKNTKNTVRKRSTKMGWKGKLDI